MAYLRLLARVWLTFYTSFRLFPFPFPFPFPRFRVFQLPQKQVYKNMNTESTYDVLVYLVPSFRTFVTRLPASPTSKQVY